MSWEDQVFHNPDGVDVDELFADLHSDDQRTQYEAAAGVYWLAHARPERVRPRSEELLDLLGDLPDFALGDEEPNPKKAKLGSGTRNWATDAVAELVVEYPERFLPRILERLDSDDERLREDAALVLGSTRGRADAEDYFDCLREHRDLLADLLGDSNWTVSLSTLSAFTGLAEEHPHTVAEFVPQVVPLLDKPEPVSSAAAFLRPICEESHEAVEPAVESMVDALGRLDSTNVQTSIPLLEALRALAEAYPERVAAVESDAVRFSRAKSASVSGPAIEVLRELRN